MQEWISRNSSRLAFAACCVPALFLIGQGFTTGFGANPVAKILNDFGYIAFLLLVATLACTPAQILFKLKWPIRIRKVLGDFFFFYACLHLTTYAVLDQSLDLRSIVKDVSKNKFIFFGMSTWLLMLPLAITSTQGWQKRLGFRRWKRLHRLIYLAGGLASLHFLFCFKTIHFEPVFWMAVVVLLLLTRIVETAWRRVLQSQA